MSEIDDQLTVKKFDYLQSKYIFRYPYTFTAIKWGMALGSFFGLHSYVRTRNIRTSFFNWMEKTVLITLTVWAYFYAKYNFYQNSIDQHQRQEDQAIREAMFLKKYLEYKLKVTEGVMSQEELLKAYQGYAQKQLERHKRMDIMLHKIDQNTFDLVPQASQKFDSTKI